MKPTFVFPPVVRPGDPVRVIAPSGPFDRTLALRGIAWLAERYRVEFDWTLFERDGFLAGSDERRLGELDRALRSDAAAIVAARGGYGLTRIAHLADWTTFRERPKWIIGFSDITALHAEAMRLGVASIHAPMVAALGRGDARGRAAWRRAVEAPTSERVFGGLDAWQPGTAEGPLVGGNLTVLFTCLAAGRLTFPDGAVLVIEDVGEAPYRLDRMLSALLAGGHLSRIGALVIGDITDAPAGRHGVTAAAVLRERLHRLRVPVLAGLPVGHELRNDPLTLGCPARVDAERGRLTVGPVSVER